MGRDATVRAEARARPALQKYSKNTAPRRRAAALPAGLYSKKKYVAQARSDGKGRTDRGEKASFCRAWNFFCGSGVRVICESSESLVGYVLSALLRTTDQGPLPNGIRIVSESYRPNKRMREHTNARMHTRTRTRTRARTHTHNALLDLARTQQDPFVEFSEQRDARNTTDKRLGHDSDATRGSAGPLRQVQRAERRAGHTTYEQLGYDSDATRGSAGPLRQVQRAERHAGLPDDQYGQDGAADQRRVQRRMAFGAVS